jgi:uncharacterized membrane protein
MLGAPESPPPRVASIDVLRGAAMVLMAIDHVRVYSGVPAGGPTPAIFFTRWVTHFCAPAFVFLAGTSAFLYGRRHTDLSRFLLTRGAWLVVLELTAIRIAWTFNFDFAHYLLAGVIWMIGWCMIVLAVLVRLPTSVVGVLGLLIVLGHNAVGPPIMRSVAASPASLASSLWKLAYVGFWSGPIVIADGGPDLHVLYSIVPWIGVMASGFAFGTIMDLDAARRRRDCLAIGLAAIGLFLALRGFNLYGDPRPWVGASAGSGGTTPMPPVLSFLNTTKYPASLSFLLMTLGPLIVSIPLVESAHGRVARWLAVFGRVPFFFYLLHIPLIHALALVVSFVRLGAVSPWLFANHPMGAPAAPDGYVWPLALLYTVWLAAIVTLYFASRWFSGVKARRHDWWLSYL